MCLILLISHDFKWNDKIDLIQYLTNKYYFWLFVYGIFSLLGLGSLLRELLPAVKFSNVAKDTEPIENYEFCFNDHRWKIKSLKLQNKSSKNARTQLQLNNQTLYIINWRNSAQNHPKLIPKPTQVYPQIHIISPLFLPSPLIAIISFF